MLMMASNEINWTAERKQPNNEYLEVDDHPANNHIILNITAIANI